MEPPLIAVVGSLDETRPHDYDPPLVDPPTGRTACEELGAELAKHNCRIVVYSSAAGFVEGDVVRGYVTSGKAQPGSIEIRYPSDTGVTFPELVTHRSLFDPRPDSSLEWEVSFYRSLRDTHGVVLIGGGRSTLVTGLIALAYRLPLVSISAFGGSAKRVWKALYNDKGIATEAEISEMGQSWHDGLAARLIDGLGAATERRVNEKEADKRRETAIRRRALVSSLVVVGLILLSVIGAALAWNWRPGSTGAVTALFVTPLLAGTAAAILRGLQKPSQEWTTTMASGLVAGAMAVFLFFAAQLTASTDVIDSPGARRLMVFAIGVSLIAGYTFDRVLAKARGTDVLQTSVLESPGPGGKE